MAVPNDALTKVNNFVPRVFDKVYNRWVPLYIPPDATETVKGMVWLADDYTLYKDYDAGMGMTAATPKAVYDLRKYVDNRFANIGGDGNLVSGVKGDKEQVYRSGNVNLTPENIGAVKTSDYISMIYGTNDQGIGDKMYTKVDAKATVAASLLPRTDFIPSVKYLDTLMASSITSDSTTMPTTAAVYNALRNLDASWIKNGTLPLSIIPQAAMERLVKVTSASEMYNLTTNDVQKGDTVLNTSTGVMYIVVDDTKLSSPSGYQEYKAGSAATAEWANNVYWADVKNVPTVSPTTSGLMTPEMYNQLQTAAGGGSYTLPVAKNGVLGGIQIGYQTNGKNYAVQLFNEKAYVNVPWDSTPPPATSDSFGGIKTGYNGGNANGANYPIKVDAYGNAYVYVPGTGDESGSDSWVPNTADKSGYVAAGSGNNNKVWKTDSSGNPGWRIDENTEYGLADQTTAGLMSATDKKRLDSMADGANNYSLPSMTTDALGGAKVGYTSTQWSNSGNGWNWACKISNNNQLFVEIPFGSTEKYGLVKSGDRIAISKGVISADWQVYGGTTVPKTEAVRAGCIYVQY